MSENKDIQELLTRGVEEVIDRQHLGSALLSGKKLRIKLGIDPTSPNIHIGRAVLLWKLRVLQQLGHHVVFIVGDFTGQIGDTSDKDSERSMLTEEQVKKNLETYFDQAFKILDKDKTETHYNSEWLKKLGFLEIGKMADKFGLNEFASRELIKKRLEAGKRVSLRELLYPLLQGYDSVAVKADVELGGTDQRFNLLAGRTIQPIYDQEPQDIIILKLLEGTDGRKMSSSWGNVINITDEPNDMFGKVMSISDDLIIKYFTLATRVPSGRIDDIKKRLESGANPRDTKIELAVEIVSLYHGDKTAKKAKEEFEKVFSRKELPEDIKEWDVKAGEGGIVDVLTRSGTVRSKTEVKRLINQKAVNVNESLVENWDYAVKSKDIIKVGPRKFLKIK
ncbi:MAG: tyrosine--tRNA ligase [Candidatus Taylorbacteria bacterium]|nr:tyrosine--tRNA ligase [Candidatus Taylorbacteria bacterium]